MNFIETIHALTAPTPVPKPSQAKADENEDPKKRTITCLQGAVTTLIWVRKAKQMSTVAILMLFAGFLYTIIDFLGIIAILAGFAYIVWQMNAITKYESYLIQRYGLK